MLPVIGSTVYRRFHAYQSKGRATVQVGAFKFRPAERGSGMITRIEFDPHYNAWFLADGKGMIAFIEGECDPDATHFEVSDVRGNSCRIRHEATDLNRLAEDFPSVNGWTAGRLQLRKLLLDSPSEMLKLVSSTELAELIGEGRFQKLIRSGLLFPEEKEVDTLAHGLALVNRALGALEGDRWQRLRGKCADIYGEIIFEMERTAIAADEVDGSDGSEV